MSVVGGETFETQTATQNYARSNLANPVGGIRADIVTKVGRLATYSIGFPSSDDTTRPLLLVHSVNAAGSAFEMKTLYDHYAKHRPVHAVDLPGFGQSDRDDREYTARVMTDAVHAAIARVQEVHGPQPIDVLGLSLSCEFVARAAAEKPEAFATLGLISPTGFEGKARDERVPSTRGQSWLLSTLRFRLWDDGFFKLLTAKPVIRKFLEKAWGSKNIDESMLEYDYHTTHQPGARYAPYYFVAGYMFSKDILSVYKSLRLPVWMAYGVRGDFVDYRHKSRVAGRSNWTIVQFDAGAMMHFEILDQVVRSYDQFLAVSAKTDAPVMSA
ncbi:Alpha/beta hydrolase [Rhodopseudomonas palustris HaA2]|uniref:Alpha/beta hydrolase n=1 Tax=Rhodopseudomonas palustris (strain HaA2) TaxID=316058 RepID=Q2J0T0_RHOP2|nr:alpha/beta fold hydrolase [Rhodopseudomonas palustris]ABD05930.1 Alpha/beta hydrolase [Rhodopseudomonas palustris HaA2]